MFSRRLAESIYLAEEVGNNDRVEDGEVVMEKESRGSVGQPSNVQ